MQLRTGHRVLAPSVCAASFSAARWLPEHSGVPGRERTARWMSVIDVRCGLISGRMRGRSVVNQAAKAEPRGESHDCLGFLVISAMRRLMGHAGSRLVGLRLAPRAEYRELPLPLVARVDQLDPVSPWSDVEAAGLTEVEQHRPGVVQQLECRPHASHTKQRVDTPNRSRDTARQGLPSRVELQTNAQSAPRRPSFMTFRRPLWVCKSPRGG
jgi:hypothetical protein